MKLDGAVSIVTGSATGVGAACALRLAAKGSRVVVNYTKSLDAARATAQACTAAGVEALLVQADIAQDSDCRRLVAAALEKWGRVDALINNAGATKFVAHHDLDGLSAEDFQRIYAVNVIGAYQMTRAAAPAMREAGAGAVVNISSLAGVMGLGSSIAYAASKGALNTMTLSLARVLGPEIRVNAICPGMIEGRWLREGMGDAAYDSLKEQVLRSTPLRAIAQPGDIAETAVWLIEGAGLMTGETLMVDGGMHLSAAPLKAR